VDSGGEERGRQAIETIDALGETLKVASITMVQPFGSFWNARLTGVIVGKTQEGRSTGSSFNTKEAAVAAAGQAFYQQLRLALRIKGDANHDPEGWAENLTQVTRTELALPSIGPPASEALLEELLGSAEERERLPRRRSGRRRRGRRSASRGSKRWPWVKIPSCPKRTRQSL